jgi:hypothetical protein
VIRRVRVPEGCDQQGRHTPGEIIEFNDEEPPRWADGWGPLLLGYGLACVVLFALAWSW